MSREKNTEKRDRTKEAIVGFGKKTADAYNDTVSDDRKSNKILIAVGILVVALIVFGWATNRIGTSDEIDSPETDYQGTLDEDDKYDQDETTNGNVKKTAYSLHDKKIVGMWGAGTEDYESLEDFKDGSWVAYSFDESGSVIKAMGEDGQTETEFGEWSTYEGNILRITWKEESGEEFFSEEMTYSTDHIDASEANEATDYLYLNEEEYTPVTETTIFS